MWKFQIKTKTPHQTPIFEFPTVINIRNRHMAHTRTQTHSKIT